MLQRQLRQKENYLLQQQKCTLQETRRNLSVKAKYWCAIFLNLCKESNKSTRQQGSNSRSNSTKQRAHIPCISSMWLTIILKGYEELLIWNHSWRENRWFQICSHSHEDPWSILNWLFFKKYVEWLSYLNVLLCLSDKSITSKMYFFIWSCFLFVCLLYFCYLKRKWEGCLELQGLEINLSLERKLAMNLYR